MILYRARSLSSRPKRQPAYEGNEPHIRIRGRWFTSVREDAVAHGEASFAPRSWELIAIDVPDDIVDGYRVATTPYTQCCLAPVDFARKPETEYVVPTFRVMDAVSMPMISSMRIVDVIDVRKAPKVADRLPKAA